MFDVSSVTGRFFAESQEISRAGAAPAPTGRRAKEAKKKKDDDDDGGPNPTAGAVARLFPFFNPRPFGFALA